MLKKLVLAKRITSFYKIFGDELEIVPCRIKARDITPDFLFGVKCDIAEAIEASFCEEAYAMRKWLDNLLTEVSK